MEAIDLLNNHAIITSSVIPASHDQYTELCFMTVEFCQVVINVPSINE